jgi:hypothetical protein
MVDNGMISLNPNKCGDEPSSVKINIVKILKFNLLELFEISSYQETSFVLSH